jgi:rhodanese-related sulfurtransferase
MALSFDQFKILLETPNNILVDTRSKDQWMNSHIPNSLHITPATVKYAVAMGAIEKTSRLILILDASLEKETLAYFSEAGFTNILGHLNGGFQTWLSMGLRHDMLIDVEVDELAMDIPFDDFLMPLDIREEDAFNKSHIKNAVSLPLAEFMDPGSMSELDEHFNIYIISEDGTTSTLAASILKKQGIHNIRIVNDGWVAVQALKDKFSFETIKKPTITKTDDTKNSFLTD